MYMCIICINIYVCTYTYILYIYPYIWLIKIYFLALFSVLVLSESKDIYVMFFLDTLIKLLYLVLVIFMGFFVSVLCKTSQIL